MDNFKKYNSIENPHQVVEKFRQYGYHRMEWLGFEKVHGSNYQFTWDYDDTNINGPVTNVKVGKRTSLLEDSEKFMNHQRIRDKYIDNVCNMFNFMQQNSPEKILKIVLFGEFYGGTGYGTEPAHKDSGHPQTSILYCCDNDFVAFDIYIIKENEKKSYCAPYDTINYCEQFSIPVLRPLHTGTLDELLKLNPEFITTIPTIFHKLNSLEGNIAEGFVLKPTNPLYMPNGSRVIVKYKCAKFMEEKPRTIKVKKSIDIPNEITGLIEEASRFITSTRLENIKAKMNDGDKINVNKTNGLLVADAYDDFIKDNTVDKKHKKFITGHLMQLARDINK